MRNTPIILVDQDGPLAGFEVKWSQIWQELYPGHPHVAWEDRKTWNLEEQYDPEYHEALNAIMDEPGFFRDLPVVEGAATGINILDDLFPGNVYICTSPMKTNPTCASDKTAWVREHLGEKWAKRMIITSDKTIVRGNYLIDDKANITGIMEPEWEHILFHTPINAGVNDGRKNMKTWVEICAFFAGYHVTNDTHPDPLLDRYFLEQMGIS